jgi:transposase InsO family protein
LDIVTDALTMAWFRRKPGAGDLFHSERGSQYASHAMSAKLREYGITASMSRFNSLKNERMHGTTYATRADAQADLCEYVEVFYNRSRRHSTLGHSSPVRFLQNWITEQAAEHPLVA